MTRSISTKLGVVRKDATIEPIGGDDEFPGSFRVVLSAPTRDRDGDTLLPEEWKQPLPDHITFDVDHGMNVASTVGSGTPTIDDAGRLIVDGTYSSLPRAQEVRTLVKEGHINRTSVAFMTEKTPTKDGRQAIVRELLNGAFVAVPSNREAVVLEAKAAVKAGARNSASDLEHIQAIHDHASALGASHDGTAPSKSAVDKLLADYSKGRMSLNAARAALSEKDADTEDASDPVALVSAVDAAIDEAIDLLAAVDLATLPAEVQQAIALIQAADATVDELMDALGIPDPDEDAATSTASQTAAAAPKAAAAARPAADTEALELQAATRRLLTTLSNLS